MTELLSTKIQEKSSIFSVDSSTEINRTLKNHNFKACYLLIPAYLTSFMNVQEINFISFFSENSINSIYTYNAKYTQDDFEEEDIILEIPIRKHVKFSFKKKAPRKLTFETIEDEDGFING